MTYVCVYANELHGYVTMFFELIRRWLLVVGCHMFMILFWPMWNSVGVWKYVCFFTRNLFATIALCYSRALQRFIKYPLTTYTGQKIDYNRGWFYNVMRTKYFLYDSRAIPNFMNTEDSIYVYHSLQHLLSFLNKKKKKKLRGEKL